MERSQLKWVWISVAFSVVVLGAVLFTTFDEKTIGYLLSLNIWYLLLALVFRIGSLVFWAWRIQVMSAPLGYKVPFGHAFNLVCVNLLAGAITPGQAGGEPVRIHQLHSGGVKVGDATAVVIMERVLDGVVLTVMGIVAIVLLGSIWSQLSLGIIVVMLTAWGLMIGIIVLLFYATRRPGYVKSKVLHLLHWIEKRLKRESIRRAICQVDYEMDNFFASVNLFTGAGRTGLFQGTVFTVLFWSSEFFIASLLLLSLGQHPFVAESFLFQLVIAAIMMVPLTPGSSGIAEISATSLYALIVPSSVLGIFVLLWRLFLYYFNIIVGVIASIFVFKRELAMKATECPKEK
ncbi:MAG: flippase-like domain-containing protein [Methanoregulaceae archaeon]|nr:flippase-like domain-containing protein [Methanoregulaceae archaeon]